MWWSSLCHVYGSDGELVAVVDEDEQLDAVVDALNELRQWREGTSARARALGMALAAAPGLSAAVAAQLAAADVTTMGDEMQSSSAGSVELPPTLQQSFNAVLGETGRVLQLAEHQLVETVYRGAVSARRLTEEGHSSKLHQSHHPHAAHVHRSCCFFRTSSVSPTRLALHHTD